MVLRKIIEIDEEKCTGCGACITTCAEGALELVDGKATVVSDVFCDGLGACIGDCPENALHIIEREAPEFDKMAVDGHLRMQKQQHDAPACPSARAQTRAIAPPQMATPQDSLLGHWPVQLRLIPENAPFLKNADLVLMADCVPVAYRNAQERFIKGNAIAIGCPKFDDSAYYIDKVAGMIVQGGIASLTVARMEVPCCGGLEHIAREAVKKAGKPLPFNTVVVGINGEIPA